MKTTNITKKIIYTLMAVLVFANVGCGKKKSNSSTNYGYGYGYGPNGYNNGYFGGSGVTSTTAGVDINGRYMLILQTSSPVNQAGYGDMPATVQGQLRVAQPMACTQMQYGAPQMGLNPGVYNLTPYDNSAILNGSTMLTNVVLIAQGPGGQAIVTVPLAHSFSTNVCGYEGMMGTLNIEQVNGYSCGLSTQFSDQMGICGF